MTNTTSTNVPLPLTVTLPVYFIKGTGDVTVSGLDQSDWIEGSSNNVPGDVINFITITSNSNDVEKTTIVTKDYVYFNRTSVDSPWTIIEPTPSNLSACYRDSGNVSYKRERGRNGLNFLWLHKTTEHHLVDPSATNIIDAFIITRGYYLNVLKWLDGQLPSEPAAPSPLELRTAYSYMMDNKMISDTFILHSGRFKYLFGSNAVPELRASFKVVRSSNTSLTDNQIKLTVIDTIKAFFDISMWEYGDTFYFTELAAAIHAALPTEIDTVVLVPTNSQNYFGDLFQVNAKEDELFLPSIGVNDIDIVTSLNRLNIRQSGS